MTHSKCVCSDVAQTHNSLDFQNTANKELLCFYDWCKPLLSHEELRRRELPPLARSAEAEDGELCVWKKRAAKKEKRVVYKAHPVEQGEEEEKVFNINHHSFEGISDGPVALVAFLKDCAKHKDLLRGSRVHAKLVGTGLLENNVFVGSALVNMYAKCGALAKSQDVFDQLRVRNIVSWNVLIAGYAHHGHGKEALNCFEKMKCEGLSPNSVTFLCVLKACITMGAADKAQEIHAEIVTEGLLENDIMVANALIDMYAKLGFLGKAQEVFDKLRIRDVVSWNALILGYAQHGHATDALYRFEQMQSKGFAPNAVTFLSILKACVSMGSIEKGEEIHAQIARDGFEEDVFVGTALVDMYAKCGSLAKAQEVFDKLQVPNLISWTALIAGYAQHGHGEEALDCYKRMLRGGLSPNAVTFVCILKACGSIRASDEGQEVHAQIVKEGLLESDMVVGTALVDMYANCGMLPEAQNIFDKFGVRDIVSWNVLIGAYAQGIHGEEALACFEQMLLEGFVPNVITFVCALRACASVGAAYKGQEIHAEIAQDQFLLDNIIVGTALLDMYANCGMLVEAQDVFNKLAAWDAVSWNALIAGYSQLGRDEIVFDLFNKMIGEGNEPDLVTFTILLNTCSHTGLLDKAHTCFETMRRLYGITPIKEHHTCMVDLYGRAGHIDNAIAVINDMPFSACRMVWQILLTACRSLGYMKLAKLAFEHAAQLDEKDPGAYVCMGNMYAAVGKHGRIVGGGPMPAELFIENLSSREKASVYKS